jgi:UDP-glucose 4-epimerase
MVSFDRNAAYRGKRVLVTGGAGAIGSNLSAALAACGARVTILDDLSSSERWNIPVHDNVRFIKGDILGEQERAASFSDAPQVVFHLAALFANQRSVEQPVEDLMVNGLGSLQVLESSRNHGVERFVYASSSSVYGADCEAPFDEAQHSLRLSTPYQITKTLGEMYCNLYSEQHDLPVVKARLFNSYGPGEIPGEYRNVTPNFIYRALKKLPLKITGTGEEKRCFTFVDDLVDGLLRCGALPQAVGETFNLGRPEEVSIQVVAESINRLTGNPAGMEYVARRSWDQRERMMPSTIKAESLLGFRPAVGIADGLRKTVDWFVKNRASIDESARFPLAELSSPSSNSL